MPSLRIARLSPALKEDFYRLHRGECGWCFCTAWHVPAWEGWTERREEDNRALRELLFEKGDGYILYTDGEPAAWMQAAPLETFPKLCENMDLRPGEGGFAVSCLMTAPERRKKGLSHAFLALVMDDLKKRGARRIYAFPLPAANAEREDMEPWTGPRSVYQKAGFAFLKNAGKREVWQKNL